MERAGSMETPRRTIGSAADAPTIVVTTDN